jgi:hypothetical protein
MAFSSVSEKLIVSDFQQYSLAMASQPSSSSNSDDGLLRALSSCAAPEPRSARSGCGFCGGCCTVRPQAHEVVTYKAHTAGDRLKRGTFLGLGVFFFLMGRIVFYSMLDYHGTLCSWDVLDNFFRVLGICWNFGSMVNNWGMAPKNQRDLLASLSNHR